MNKEHRPGYVGPKETVEQIRALLELIKADKGDYWYGRAIMRINKALALLKPCPTCKGSKIKPRKYDMSDPDDEPCPACQAGHAEKLTLPKETEELIEEYYERLEPAEKPESSTRVGNGCPARFIPEGEFMKETRESIRMCNTGKTTSKQDCLVEISYNLCTLLIRPQRYGIQKELRGKQ